MAKHMLYTITYDIKDSKKEEVFLKNMGKYGEIVMFMPRCYFLNSDQTRNIIYDELYKSIDESDLLYIAETPLSSMSGWLPHSAVDWVSKNG
jgi:hypothetical protein